MTRPIDLTGKRFGRLVAIKPVGNDKHGSKQWLCECDCGNTAIVVSSSLTKGNTRSCGCIASEKIAARNYRHGLRRTRLYHIHQGMKQRCGNPSHSSYKDYGAKGVKVCDEWKNFEKFYAWAMANGYTESMTIDRIDNSHGYSPDNCRWVSAFDQASNKKNNHNVTWNGETHTLAEWSRITGIRSELLRYRLRRGMDLNLVFKK